MKTYPVFAHGIGLLLVLSGSVLAQPPSVTSDWQSLKIEQTVTPEYPPQLLLRGITSGQADIAIATDARGRLDDLLAVSYTRPEFAKAAVAAIRQWRFEPAWWRGGPVGTVAQLRFRFSAEGTVVSCVTAGEFLDMQLARLLGARNEYGPCPAGKLDRAPVPIATVAPQYPQQLAKHGVRGAVTVEFYIDPAGAVRLPMVDSRKDNLILGALAVEAVSRWKFTPPTSKGQPVLVRAIETFYFGQST